MAVANTTATLSTKLLTERNSAMKKTVLTTLLSLTAIAAVIAVMIIAFSNTPRSVTSHAPAAGSGQVARQTTQNTPVAATDESAPQGGDNSRDDSEALQENLPEVEGNQIAGYSGLISELKKLKNCANGADCGLPQTDPRSAELELGQRFARTIDKMTLLAQAGIGDETTYQKVAQEYVKHPDGHVQEAALELMAACDPDPQNVASLVAGLTDTHDAQIYRMALMEFSRYDDPQLRNDIDNLLIDTLKTGGHFASQEVANDILPMLNEQNIDKYKTTLTELPANTAKAKALKANIEEFELQQSGG